MAPSAHRHGLTEQVILHAFRNPISYTEGDEGMTMLVGSAPSGALIEVGVVEADDGVLVIVHAMPARMKYVRW